MLFDLDAIIHATVGGLVIGLVIGIAATLLLFVNGHVGECFLKPLTPTKDIDP